MSNDARDLSAAVAGDPEAFARLYERHAGLVLSLCRRRWTLDQAEDAMQETFLRAYRRLDQLKRPEGFRSWLYAIARRVCSERRRSNERRNRHEATAAQNRARAEPQAVTSAHIVERAEQLESLTAAMDELPDNERLAVHLYYLDSEPLKTASAVLGVSRSGFYKLLARARRHLAISMREAQPT